MDGRIRRYWKYIAGCRPGYVAPDSFWEIIELEWKMLALGISVPNWRMDRPLTKERN